MADRFGYGEIGLDINPCRGCEDYDEPDGCKSNGGCGKPITNYDRIISKTPEELAEWIYQVQDGDAYQKENFLPPLSKSWWLKWLKQEVTE